MMMTKSMALLLQSAAKVANSEQERRLLAPAIVKHFGWDHNMIPHVSAAMRDGYILGKAVVR